MKSQDIKLGVYKVICLAVKHHNHTLTAQISIMQSLQFYEHLSEPMAECLTVLAKEFDYAQLGDEILREIAAKSFSAQDSKGPRAFSRFLIRYGELAPRSVLKQISVLLAHLDSEVGHSFLDIVPMLTQFSGLPYANSASRSYRLYHQRSSIVRNGRRRIVDFTSYETNQRTVRPLARTHARRRIVRSHQSARSPFEALRLELQIP